MKTTFKLFALLLAVGYPILAIAQVFGAHLPSSINAENVTVVFSFAMLALIVIGDYGRRNTLKLNLTPTCCTVGRRTCEAHRLAA
jgi:ABC-type branched-subunit amino acid transport system permease subunit